MAIGRLLYTFNGTIFDEKAFDNKKMKHDSQLSDIHKEALKTKKCEKGNNGEYKSVLNKFNLLEIAEYILNYHIVLTNRIIVKTTPKDRVLKKRLLRIFLRKITG